MASRCFDSIVVITDRRVLDRQLQGTIKQFEKIKGTVTKIDRNTKQLVKALERGDKIIITTLQKIRLCRRDGKDTGQAFRRVVDEAHSSQTGENVKDLHVVLTSEEQLEEALNKDDESEKPIDPIESELEKIQKARQKLPHLSFFAFTATPKDKTLELFGAKDTSGKKGVSSFPPVHHAPGHRRGVHPGCVGELHHLQDLLRADCRTKRPMGKRRWKNSRPGG